MKNFPKEHGHTISDEQIDIYCLNRVSTQVVKQTAV